MLGFNALGKLVLGQISGDQRLLSTVFINSNIFGFDLLGLRETKYLNVNFFGNAVLSFDFIESRHSNLNSFGSDFIGNSLTVTKFTNANNIGSQRITYNLIFDGLLLSNKQIFNNNIFNLAGLLSKAYGRNIVERFKKGTYRQTHVQTTSPYMNRWRWY